jgi:adenylate cyclase
LLPDKIPFVSDRDSTDVSELYLPAPDHKAIAVSFSRIGMITGQADAETARTGALENCRKTLEAAAINNKCWLYAIGNTVVYQGGYPPMPSRPWFRSDPSIDKPFNSNDVPLVGEHTRSWIEKNYPGAGKPKALALSPRDAAFRYYGAASQDEAARRALEGCGSGAGVPCLIIAIDDMFVVPIPTMVKAVGFFQAVGNSLLAPGIRDDAARRLASGTSGWSAVAAGASGLPGIVLGAGGEQSAIEGALADCGKHDHGCHVIALGPFSVVAADASKAP